MVLSKVEAKIYLPFGENCANELKQFQVNKLVK
jgi:hypothetical protein